MATTMEQRAKFRELRLAGTTREDAMKQAYGDLTAPTPTGVATIPTQNFPSQPINQQTTTGVNGETFQVAPVNQQGVTPQAPQSVAPIQPVAPNTPPPTQNVTPTPTATPEKKTVAPQVDFNVSQGREGEIQKNIADITATNPTLLKDRNAYNQAFGYTTADQGKKAILDSAFQSGQPQIPNADMMFSSIVMKAPVPDDQKTTTQYKIAQNRYLKANSYASMTPAQVSSDITSGKLIEGSQTYEDIKALNPKLIQDTNNLRIVNGSKVSLYSADAQGNRVNNVEQSFTEDYLGNFGTFLKSLFTVQTPDQIQAIIRTDEVKDAEAKADEYERELNAIEEGGLEIEKRVRKELEGTGASSERIRLEIAIAQEENDKKYNSVLKKYTQFANKANNLMTQNTAAYQESQKQQTAQQQALAGAAGQVFSQGLSQQNAVFQANLGLQTKQAEFEQSLQQQADMAKDPTSAIGGILSQFQKLGITSDMDVAGHLASYEASGLTLPEYTAQMIQNFKAKPEYQKAMELQMGQLSDAQKMQLGYQQDIAKMKMQQDFSLSSDIRNFEQQKEIAKLNNDYNRQDFLFQLENDPTKRLAMVELEQKLNANKSLFDVLGKNVGTYEGNRGYDLAGKLGDPMPAGGNWEVVSVDQAGELGVPYRAGMKKPYGNTVVMRDENGNEVRYSHLESIGVKPGDKLAFGDIVGTRGNTGNVRGANGETLTAEQLKAGRGAHLDIEIKSNGRLLSQNEQIDYLKSKKAGATTGLTDKQFTQYNQTKTNFKSEPIVKAFEESLIAGGDIIQSLGSENGPGDVGAVFNFMKSLDPTSTVREGEFALAAKSAGVWESFKNIPANKLEGTILTDKQRKDFGKLALKYIESKGKLYDTKYDDMTKVLKQQGVPESYYPTRMTDYVKQYKSVAPGATATTEKPYSKYE